MSNSGLGYSVLVQRSTFTTYLAAGKIMGHKVDAVSRVEADSDTYIIGIWGNQTDDFIDQVNQWVTGNAKAPGPVEIEDNLWLDAPSPTNTAGDQTGSPEFISDKSDAGIGRYSFFRLGNRNWSWSQEANDDLYLNRYDTSGVFQSQDRIEAANGNWTLAKDVALLSASPELLLGDATGLPQIRMNRDTSLSNYITLQAEGVTEWQVVHNSNQNLIFNKIGGAYVFRLIQVDSRAEFAGNVELEGASAMLSVGDNTGSPVLQLRGDTSTGKNLIQLVAGGDLYWAFRMDGSEGLAFRRFIAGVFQDDALVIANASGTVTVANNGYYSNPNAILTIGDGTGEGKLRTDGEGSVARTHYQILSDGIVTWGWALLTSDTLKLTYAGGQNFDFQAAGNFNVNSGDVSLLSASPKLLVGDATGSPQIVLDKVSAGTALIDLQNEGVSQWSLNCLATNAFEFRRVGGSVVWSASQTNGNMFFGFSVTLASASPLLTVGIGTGDPNIVLNKATANGATITWQDVGTRRWRHLFNSGEAFVLQRFDAGGSFLDEPITVAVSGNIAFAHDLALDSASPIFTAGDGLGTPQLRLVGATVSYQYWFLGDTTFSVGDFRWAHTASNLVLQRHDGIAERNVLQVTSDTFMRVLGGAQSSSQLAIGNAGYSGGEDAGILLEAGPTGNPYIYWESANAAITYSVSAFTYTWYISGDPELVLGSDVLRPGVTRGSTLGDPTYWWRSAHVSDVFNLGDGVTAQPQLVRNKTDVGEVVDDWKVAGTIRWRLAFTDSEHLDLANFDAGGSFTGWPLRIDDEDTVTLLHSDGLLTINGSVMLSGASNTQAVYWVDFGNASFFDESAQLFSWFINSTLKGAIETSQFVYYGNISSWAASPTVSIGDHTGSPSLVRRKSDAGTFTDRWVSNTVVRWALSFFSDEFLYMQEYNSSGVFVRNTYAIAPDFFEFGTTTVNMAVASVVLTLGDGTGSPTRSMAKGATSEAVDLWMAGGTNEFRTTLDSNERYGLQVWTGSWQDVWYVNDGEQDVHFAANVEVQGQAYSPEVSHAPSGTTQTIDWDDGNVHLVDLYQATGNVTLTLNNPELGAVYFIVVRQVAEGTTRNLIWPASVAWPGGTAPTISTGFNDVDLIRLVYSAANNEYLATFDQDFAA